MARLGLTAWILIGILFAAILALCGPRGSANETRVRTLTRSRAAPLLSGKINSGWGGAPLATAHCHNYGGGDWNCGNGYIGAKNGVVTSVSTPYGNGAQFAGSGWFNFGNKGNALNKGTWAAIIYPTTTNTAVIWGKDEAGKRAYFFGTLTSNALYIFNQAGSYKYVTPYYSAANNWQIMIASFANVGGTTYVGYAQTNASTGSNMNMYGPIAQTTGSLTLGERLYSGSEARFVGTVAIATYWEDWSATPAEQAVAIASPPTF